MAWTASWTATWTIAKSRNGMGLGRAGFAATNACTAMLFQAVAASGAGLAAPIAVAARVVVDELRTAEATRTTTAMVRSLFRVLQGIPRMLFPFIGFRV